ncbi:MAG: hypothetical protein ACOVP1_08260 [Bacteroidia bacterium]
MKFNFSLLLICLLTACRSTGIIGTWEIEELNIKLNSINNTNDTQIFSAKRENWETKMRSRNIQTTYTSDGKYHSLHRNLKDSITYDPHGYYQIKGDSLYITDTFPKKQNYVFKMKLNKKQVEFFGMEDFDGDGKIDDEYYSKQIKIK